MPIYGPMTSYHQKNDDDMWSFIQGWLPSSADGKKANETPGLANGEVAKEKGVDESEDGGVCADAEG
jgi:hypothetical protein